MSKAGRQVSKGTTKAKCEGSILNTKRKHIHIQKRIFRRSPIRIVREKQGVLWILSLGESLPLRTLVGLKEHLKGGIGGPKAVSAPCHQTPNSAQQPQTLSAAGTH